MAAKKIVPLYDDESENDRATILTELRKEVREGRGIAKIQAMKLLLELIGARSSKDEDDDEPCTFELAGRLRDTLKPDENTSNASTAGNP